MLSFKVMGKASQYGVLVVDDDDGYRDVLSTALARAGFQVYAASNGEDGITQAKQVRPSLILLDVEMPVLSGVDTALRMQGDPALQGIKKVFITSYGDPAREAAWLDEKFAREIGAVDYIRKTDDLARIVAHVMKILRVAPERSDT